MRNATFRQLQVFAAVARNLSYSRAAEELHLTQPAVSMQVSALEQIAGLPLFEQVGRRIALTEAGERMLAYANASADLMRDARESLDARKGLRIGTLKLSAVSTAAYFAPALLAAYARQHPGITIRLSVGNREQMVHELANNETDLVIMGRAPPELATTSAPIAPHPLAIVAAPTHPLAGARRIPLKRLAEEPFLMREPGSGTRAAMERVFQEHGLTYRSTMEVSSNETIKQAVIAGMGISFLSLHTAGLELQAHKLVVLDVVGLPIVREWHVIHREDKRLSPAATAFRDFLKVEGAALIARAVDLPAMTTRRGNVKRVRAKDASRAT
jgi:DNA-binding transcriptional LysR family regulator